MKKNTETFDEQLKRINQLAGVKPINESKGTPTTILSNTVGSDNVNYAIVKEEGSYYIKTSINENELDYIGGMKNKHNNKYKYDSYAHASRNLNMMMIELNETFSPEKNDAEIVNERLEKDLGGEGIPPVAPGEGGGIPQDAPAPAPMPQAPSPEPAPQAPAPEVAPQAPVAEPEANNDGLADDDSDLMGSEAGDDIDHYVGKLTSEIRNAGNDQMGEDKVKSILNSIISALPLDIVAPEERLVIARRVKMGGKGKEEEPAPQAPAPEVAPQDVEEITIPMDEIISPLDKPTSQFKEPHDFNKQDDVKINEFFANIVDGDFVSENNVVKYGNVLIEADDKNITLISGDKKYEYNVSEETISKFKNLLK